MKRIKYEYATAQVESIDRGKGGWVNWWVTVHYSSDSSLKFKIKKEQYTYRLSTKYFTTDSLPSVGDFVKIRCRLTNDFPDFEESRAMIVGVIKDYGRQN